MKYRYLFFAILIPILCRGQAVKSFNQTANGIQVDLAEGMLKVIPIAENAVRIQYHIGEEDKLPELIFTHIDKYPNLRVAESSSELELKGQKIIVIVDKQTGKLTFTDNDGKIFLNEKSDSRQLIPDSVLGEPCFVALQSFESPEDEFILGLGQFQDGHYNIRQVSRRLTQVNSQISLPIISVSYTHLTLPTKRIV